MTSARSLSEPGYPINYVARKTGLSAYAIRMWERRHAVVEPQRTASGHRRYSEDEVRRLTLLRRATAAGYPIGSLTELSNDQLGSLIRDTTEAIGTGRGPLPGEPDGEDTQGRLLQECCEAVNRLDRNRLDALLASVGVQMPCVDGLERVVAPLMRWVGNCWSDGSIRVAHEHLATACVRSYLERVCSSIRCDATSPGVVLTTPSGERHEIGILMAAVVAATEGWRVHYFGPDLPTTEVVQAARETGAKAVALGASNIGHEAQFADQVAELRSLLPAEVRIVAGGAGAAGVLTELEGLGIDYAETLGHFRDLLRAQS